MCVVQIGKLVSQLSDEVKSQNEAIPWRIIKDTRNFYVHAYGSIDIPSVWDTLINDIPALKTACENILTHFGAVDPEYEKSRQGRTRTTEIFPSKPC